MTSHRSVRGSFVVDGSGVRGLAYDVDDLARRLAVELVIDGWPVDLARADDFCVEAAGVGDGCYGFGFRLPDAVLGRDGMVEIRVANTGEPIGGAVSLPGSQTAPAPAGRVTWAGGLRLTGWVETPPEDDIGGVRLVVERRLVAEAPARGFVTVVQGATRRTKARFDVRLPEAFADGRVHRVTAVDRRGRLLEGSPCSVLAFADGLRDALLERSGLLDGDPRAELIHRLLPRSVPFSELDVWLDRHPVSPTPRLTPKTSVGLLLLGDDVEATVASLDGQSHRTWFALSAPAVRGPGTLDPSAVAEGLAAESGCEAVIVAPAGARFHPEALARLGALAIEGEAVVYPDATMRTTAGVLPLLWPAFDRERQMEQGYAALAFAAGTAAVSAALRHGASSAFSLFAALAAASTPIHLPEILVELPRPHPTLGQTLAAASGASAEHIATPVAPDRETGLPVVRLRRTHPGNGIALAVIAPEPWVPDLTRAARAVADDAERILVSHRPLPAPLGWKTLVVAGGRNPSKLREAALATVRAPLLLLLDAGVEPQHEGEGAELASRLTDGAVAAGGLVLDEDGLVASAGLVLGPGFTAIPAFAGFDPETGGYAGALALTRNCGALDPAALLIDRAAAAAAGGFDAALYPEHHGTVDLCLRLRAAGGRLVVAPRARFVRCCTWRHRGDGTAQAVELETLRRRWGDDLACDPFYHPGLNHDAAPFSALAWPARPRSPRRPEPPRERTTKSEA